MSALPPDDLVRLWAEEELAPERAIGYLLQHVATMQSMLQRQAQTLSQLRIELASLTVTSETGKTPHVRRRPTK